jgi:hypothetical protein
MKQNKDKDVVHQFECGVDKLMIYFAHKYFGKDYEQFWVGDKIGDVCFINDCFFSIEDMCDFLKYRYSKKDMFDYYYFRLDAYEKTTIVPCIRDWKDMKNVKLCVGKPIKKKK